MLTTSVLIVLPLAVFLGLIGMLVGQLTNRGGRHEGGPVAPGLMPAALALAVVPQLIQTVVHYQLLGLYALPVIVLLLGGAMGAWMRRRQAAETPPARFRRFDVAAGILALNPIMRLIQVVIAVRMQIQPPSWIPIVLLVLAVFVMVRTRRPDRPARGSAVETACIVGAGILLSINAFRAEIGALRIGSIDVVGITALCVTILVCTYLEMAGRGSRNA